MGPAKAPKPRISRVRRNLPRPAKWRCTQCDTWNAATDLRCHICSS